MKFEHTQVFNFEGAIRGMRNPLESWAKSDSCVKYNYNGNSNWQMFQYEEEQAEFVIDKLVNTRSSTVIHKINFLIKQISDFEKVFEEQAQDSNSRS